MSSDLSVSGTVAVHVYISENISACSCDTGLLEVLSSSAAAAAEPVQFSQMMQRRRTNCSEQDACYLNRTNQPTPHTPSLNFA